MGFGVKSVLGVLLVLPFHSAIPTDELSVRDDARKIITTLASPKYWGRGYTKNGMAKASKFLEHELQSIAVQPLDGKSFRQDFEYPVNTFPSTVDVALNGKELTPGVDYIVSPDAKGVDAEGDLVANAAGEFVDATHGITVVQKDKLTWSVAGKVADTTKITIDHLRHPETPTHIRVKLKNEFVEHFQAANLCAVVPGTKNPDTYLVLSAHYDHLGGMGRKAYFPGANDNASGTTLLLEFAKYYAKHPQPYSVVFLFFAGEEAGLIGSKYFVDHPLVDLKKIHFVINFDMTGTGDTGITAVNATEYPQAFTMLQDENTRGRYLVNVYPRGKAANSDHYWFSENGVPAFFIYTMGGIAAYHDVFDRSTTLPLTKFEELYHLILGFNDKVMAD